jgi:hypothetical protein
MAVQKKMAFFVPAAGDAALGGEFDCWHPDTRFEQEEQRGDGIWKGTDVPAIPAEVGMPMVDLPKLLTHMIKHAWQAATPTPAPGHAQVAFAWPRPASSSTPRTSSGTPRPGIKRPPSPPPAGRTSVPARA